MNTFFVAPILFSNRRVSPVAFVARNEQHAIQLASQHWPCAINFQVVII